jgi:putative membrane protein
MAVKLGKSSFGWYVGMFVLAPIMAWAGSDAIAPKDQQFLMTAAGAQKAEVALGQMAIERAASEKVKQLAQRMVEDHTKAGQEVRKLAEAAGITLPDEPSVDLQKLGDTYSKLSGNEFDRAYVDHEVKDHQKKIAEFKKQTKKLKNPQIKQWASGTVPVLKEHLIVAKSVSASIKKGSHKQAR